MNISVNIRSEIKLGARARTYQRPATPYRRVPGHPTTPSVPREHGPTRPCPLRAARGAHGAPRAAACSPPRDGARERRKRRGYTAALCAAAGGRHSARTPPVLSDAVEQSAAAGAAVKQPAAAATARPGTTAAASAALDGGLAVASQRPGRLRDAASELACIRLGIGARQVQRKGRHGKVSEG